MEFCCDLSCFQGFHDYSQAAMSLIDKALGNIRISHPQITFLGLMNTKKNKAKLIQYMASEELYSDIFIKEENDSDLDEGQQEYLRNLKKQKAQMERLKQKTHRIINMALQYKIAQKKMAKELGFHYSSECFIKGDKTIIVLYEIGGLGEVDGQPIAAEKDENFSLVIQFEMEPIKVELFDCDQFIISIDDLVVQLIDTLKFDHEQSDEY